MNSVYVFVGLLYLVLLIITVVTSIYQFAFSLFGIKEGRTAVASPPVKRFAVIIPGHNEERVIGPLIESIKAQHYPMELIDIHLIADNCTDHTADVGRKYGAIVHERFDPVHAGKGYAIEWMIGQLRTYGEAYDAIVMFDADNLVDADFLSIMNDKLCRGHRVIQGYLGVKNPFDTWVSVSLALSYWYDNRMWQHARQNLNLPCALGGTGLCIDYNLLQEMGWGATGLTEDLEFGVRCVERGVIPTWAHEAKVFDEKPTTFFASFRQRLRWQQGHFQCAHDHMLPLFIQGIKERNLSKFDTAVYLFQPMRAIIVLMMSVILFVADYLLPARIAHLMIYPLPEEILIVTGAVLFLQIPFTLLLERSNWRAYFGLVIMPLFLWTWGPVSLHAYFTRNNKKWYHTVHKRSLRLSQIKDS
ncbi:MAG: glycosyltransferase family 2 protein [Alicyclobacillaceae bacterium]|jgi:cellulose synthase/poly-beta-1,6-N-acetylglucosamine synthase-like glycosyltransferase|uniref:glycosyltransferase family 2 protein n=1 Tax=Alicyclobacillus sp. SP_1 TaxID=2942475 RepID=UPI002157E3EA|nr:glycosyltransferase family 2 protein [Alicyclobacillus sp. SP_1]MCY0888351.1 glycosyltransferase family 2 protein [Alicyclobacillaceae bacterium]MCY0895711.1 glycosyltransferase family 2 protein [Alicyclobacillaceae bacterium]